MILKYVCALTGVSQLVECPPAKQKVAGSIPDQGTWLGPWLGSERQVIQSAFLSLSFPFPSPLSKRKEINSLKENTSGRSLTHFPSKSQAPSSSPWMWAALSDWLLRSRMRQNDLQGQVIKVIGASVLLSVQEVIHQVRKTLQQPWGEEYVELRSKAAPTCQPGGRCLGSRSSSLSQAFRGISRESEPEPG